MSSWSTTILLALGFLACLCSGQEATPAAAAITAEKEIAGPLNGFSSRVFRLVSGEKKNIVISPFSLATALGMLMLGSRGETETLIKKTLGLESVPDPNQVHKLFHDLISGRISNSSSFELVNEALLQMNPGSVQEVFDKYKADVKKTYSAVAKEVDFAHDGQAIKDRVNKEVSEATHGTIPSVLDSVPSSDTVFLLLNAIYFRQQWLMPFNPAQTRSMKFYNHGAEAEAVDVAFMVRRSAWFGGSDTEIGGQTATTLQMEYKDEKTAMVIVLPDARDGLQQMLASNSFDADLAATLQTLRHKETPLRKTNVYLPKFKFDSDFDLKQVLGDLGMASLFTAGADFSGITGDKSVRLSKAKQKAFINVDEKGTEAAAVSTLHGVSRSLTEEYEFKADHPFLFLIQDLESGLVFFLGKLEAL